MIKTKRALIVSGAIILLCFSIIAGMTYALFTDSVSVNNHIVAGTLKVGFIRTNLEYKVLDSEGRLFEGGTSNPVDFRDPTVTEGVFGDSKNQLVIPGSYFDADLQVSNLGNVAFNYSFGITIDESCYNSQDELVEIANQLDLIVTKEGQTEPVYKGKLSGWSTKTDVGELKKGEIGKFNVRVDFPDLDDTNNAAMKNTVIFDLCLYAVQSTK